MTIEKAETLVREAREARERAGLPAVQITRRLTFQDGFIIELADCGGFNLYTPRGKVIAWAEDMELALEKIRRERRERMWS
jgi:hypothetical protein